MSVMDDKTLAAEIWACRKEIQRIHDQACRIEEVIFGEPTVWGYHKRTYRSANVIPFTPYRRQP